MSEEIYDPRERLEIFLNAIRTGDVEDLPDPQTREEMYLAAIAGKSALPDPTDASVGAALVLDADKNPVWVTPTPPESKKYYLHLVTGTSHSQKVEVSIITSSETSFTSTTLNSYLYQLGTSAGGISYPASGSFIDSGTLIIVRGIYYTSSKASLYTQGVTITDGALTSTGFGSDNFNFSSDTVKEI